MAPRTRSQAKALNTNTALKKTMKPIPLPVHYDSSTSSSSTSMSSSYALLLNSLSAKQVPRSPTLSNSELSFDEDELNFVYQKCQVMVDNLHIIHPTDSQDHCNRIQSHLDDSHNESQELDDDDALQSVYQKCQAMMNHLNLDRSHSGDNPNNNEKSSNDSGDDYMEGHSHPSPPASPHPPMSESESGQDNEGPSMQHIISMSSHHLISIIRIHDFVVCSMARPTMWAIAYENLSTLKHQTWIDASILNLFLLSLWYSVSGQSHVRYVDFFSAIPSISSGIHSMPGFQEIQLFQQRHLFNSLPGDPAIPVSFVVLSLDHFFVVIFDYQANLAFVLGRRISGNITQDPDPYYDHLLDDWNRWNGPLYWMRIAALHGYNAVEPDQVDVQVRNWIQNGYDCGPIASFVLESLMNTGLYGSDDTLYIPPIPCGHRLRLRMLATVKDTCRRSWEDYRYLASAHLPAGDIWTEWDDTSAVTEHTITAVQQESSGNQLAAIIQELNVVAANCLACQRANAGRCSALNDHPFDSDAPNNQESENENENEEDTNRSIINQKSQRLKQLLRRYPYVNKARARDHLPPRAVHGREEPAVEILIENMRDRRHVKDWTTGVMFRFPRPISAVELLPYKGHRWIPFDRTYDDYEGGPILESLQLARNPYEIVEEPYYRPGLWTSFRDYGYRLLRSFGQMFYLDRPIKLTDHILSVGTLERYNATHQVNHYITGMPIYFVALFHYQFLTVLCSGKYSLHRGPMTLSNHVQVEDAIILSPAQMIEASMSTSDDLIKTFLCGKNKDNRHICLDMELNHIPLTMEDLDVTVDIDSLIWVTRSLHFNTPMAVYLGPIVEDKAPMHRNNHVYVDILVPQSQQDANAIGGRTEWLTMAFPLCGIPNTYFGLLSNSAGAMYVYICFPRMIHRDEMTHKRANRIPKEVLDFFWEHLLLPAIRQHADIGSTPYVSLTLNEVRFKARKGGKRASRPKAVPFTMDVLRKIQNTMEDMIQADPKRFANYGSFFFVLECKGIKLWTTTSLFIEDTSPINVLLRAFPALDWTYMIDRNNGELLVDLGIGIHPKYSRNLVGLWRLEVLEASFGAGGFLRGNAHHTCTLGRYGGLQAEMAQERARQTHITFRNTYNLTYEVVRPNDNQPTFAMDRDAYALNNTFMEECTQAISMYSGAAKKRSYGVRDEYRMGGMAMMDIMTELPRKVCHFHYIILNYGL
jgi:hypothetical protein